jgi:hypothetical protein
MHSKHDTNIRYTSAIRTGITVTVTTFTSENPYEHDLHMQFAHQSKLNLTSAAWQRSPCQSGDRMNAQQYFMIEKYFFAFMCIYYISCLPNFLLGLERTSLDK